MAGANVRFLGRVPDAELPRLMAHCRAFLFPGREDFGIAPVQAMAAGRPVIAFAAGGALDYVIDGQTGLFFDEQTPKSLAGALGRFDAAAFDPARIRTHAERFDTHLFKSRLKALIEEQTFSSGAASGNECPPFPALKETQEQMRNSWN
jgi:glycosyltransferase involved in cell wall biosynthesis